MHITDLCKSRWKLPNGTLSPLLIPSFSSRGFPELSNIYEILSKHISDVSLVSAFDIYNGYLNSEKIYSSDTVFIDSGGYEIKPVYDPIEAYHDSRTSDNWNIGLYKDTLKTLNDFSDLIIVSYDDLNKIPLEKQIANATNFLGEYPKFSLDFLWKPEPEKDFYGNPNALIKYKEQLKKFRCIGVTDKELGNSLIDRCLKIIEIRSTLIECECNNLPIHVFGCLDPLISLLFFLCGADVFDGLSWLRYVYQNNSLLYRQQFSIYNHNFNLSDQEICIASWIDNLDALCNLRNRMKNYSETFNVSSLYLNEQEINWLFPISRGRH